MKKKADPALNKKEEKRSDNPYVNHESMIYYKMKEEYSNSMSAEKKKSKPKPKFQFWKKSEKKQEAARTKSEPIPMFQSGKKPVKKGEGARTKSEPILMFQSGKKPVKKGEGARTKSEPIPMFQSEKKPMKKEEPVRTKSKSIFRFGKKTVKKEEEARSKSEPQKIVPFKESARSVVKKKDVVAPQSKQATQTGPVEVKKKPSNKVSIVEKKAKRRSFFRDMGMTVLIVMVFCVVFSFSVMLVERYSKIAQIKYDINSLNKEASDKQREIDELQVQLESQNRSDIIEKYAREELGMEYPKESKITYIHVN